MAGGIAAAAMGQRKNRLRNAVLGTVGGGLYGAVGSRALIKVGKMGKKFRDRKKK